MSYGKIYETTWWGNPVTDGWGGIYSALSSDPTEFRFTVKTDNAGTSNNDQFKLPLDSTFSSITAKVDWGDGNTDDITTYNQSEVTHTYSSAGTYTIKITNALKGFRFNNGGDKLKMLDIQNWGVFDNTSSRAFKGCANLTQTATDSPVLSSANISEMFRDCILYDANLNNWDVSSVTNTSQMFRNTSINSPLDNWDVSNVTNMSTMFNGVSTFNQDLSGWDISKVSNGTNFMLNCTGFSTENYDKLLIGWEATLQSQFPNGSGYSLSPSWRFQTAYTGGGAAATARASLVSNYNWTIIDLGTA
jgi:surface protein